MTKILDDLGTWWPMNWRKPKATAPPLEEQLKASQALAESQRVEIETLKDAAMRAERFHAGVLAAAKEVAKDEAEAHARAELALDQKGWNAEATLAAHLNTRDIERDSLFKLVEDSHADNLQLSKDLATAQRERIEAVADMLKLSKDNLQLRQDLATRLEEQKVLSEERNDWRQHAENDYWALREERAMWFPPSSMSGPVRVEGQGGIIATLRDRLGLGKEQVVPLHTSYLVAPLETWEQFARELPVVPPPFVAELSTCVAYTQALIFRALQWFPGGAWGYLDVALPILPEGPRDPHRVFAFVCTLPDGSLAVRCIEWLTNYIKNPPPERKVFDPVAVGYQAYRGEM